MRSSRLEILPWTLLSSIAVLLHGINCRTPEYVVRPTTLGDIRGHTVPFDDDPNQQLDVFVGIPYAAPPTGPLRWTRPVDPQGWTGSTRDALSFSSCCPQDLTALRRSAFGPDFNDTDEDCLYLNVYAPRAAGEAPQPGQAAVMVWVHGGSHRRGCGEVFDGRILAQQGVVVVTLNYRIGVMGFLTTEDEVAPGNYGLLDIVQALHWVQDNIANFGGDPSRVTIFGNSAGGNLVSQLMFTPTTEGLFQRVIPQSGDAMSPWSIVRPPYSARYWAEQMAEQLDCPSDDNLLMIACLRTKDPEELVDFLPSSGTQFTSAWIPRVDNYLIFDLPENRLASGQFHQVDLMTGTVPEETVNYYEDIPGIEDGFSREEWEAQMYDWSTRFTSHTDLIYEAIRYEYGWPGDDRPKFRDLLIEMRSDDGYIAPHNKHAIGHSSHVTNTYLYSFEYRSPLHPDPDWMGVPHGDEYYYIFGAPFWGAPPAQERCPWGCRNIIWYTRQPTYLPEDLEVATAVMETWANFAKTGDPSTSDFTWSQFNSTHEFYTRIGGSMTLDQFYKYHKVLFLNQYRPTLLEIEV